MKLFNYFKISIMALLQNKVRTLLTLLGIVIGIGSVIAIIGLSTGATQSITSQFSTLGTRTVTINPGQASQTGGGARPPGANALSSSNLRLEEEVLQTIENKLDPNTYDTISPTQSSSYEITNRDKTSTSRVTGVEQGYFQTTSITLNEGRQINNSEFLKGSKVVIISEGVSTRLFGNKSAIGQSILIGKVDLEVIGVSKSSNFGADQSIIPLNLMQSQVSKSEGYSSIAFVAKDGQLNKIQEELKKILLNYYNIDNEKDANFNITNSQSILDTANTITGTLSALLIAVAAISLLVGGIGIMNIMLVTVSERTKEIGLRKALGAKINDILLQFLIESVVVSLVGGIIGVILGSAISIFAGSLFGISSVITPTAILLATGISCGIGIIFGFYPAYKAAQLQPIDALKYE